MLLTRKEFSEAVGASYSVVVSYINQKRIVVDKKTNKIDTDNGVNILFIAKQKAKGKVKPEFMNLGKLPEPKTQPKKRGRPANSKNQKPIEGESLKLADGTIVSAFDLEVKRKMLDNEKKEVDIRVKKLEEQRLEGKSIPTFIVENLIAQLSKSFIKTYSDGTENFSTEFSHKNKLTVHQAAELKSGLVDMINKAHDAAIQQTKKDLKIIINDVKMSNK